MILVANYPPVINSCARLYSELAESLVLMGHKVTVITEYPFDDISVDKNHKYYRNRRCMINLNGVCVYRVLPLTFFAKIPGGKALRFLLSCFLFAIRGIFTGRQDVILVYSPPLYMGISGYIISLFKRINFVFNMQDIHPQVLFDSGAIKNKFFKVLFSKMEEFCYRKANSFIVYSTGNKDYLLENKVDREVFIIPNWVDTTTMGTHKKKNSLREDKLISDKFVVTYAGAMQEAQGLKIVVMAAEVLKECDNILFILVGEGPSKTPLQNLIQEKKLNNITMYPMMPKDHYIQLIYDSDVCLVTLSADIPLQTVPGKLADIMVRGKPVIAVVNPLGDTASIIKEAQCGFCVNPGDAQALSIVLMNLRTDKELKERMGANARLYAEKYFSRDICTKQYDEVLSMSIKGNCGGYRKKSKCAEIVQESCAAEKPVILLFTGNYLPGYKAGGILRVTTNTIDHLHEEFDFKIVTTDRDLGDDKPYPDIKHNQWQIVGNAKVFYLSPQSLSFRNIYNLIQNTSHDILFLNSFLNYLTIKALLIRKFCRIAFMPVIVAPFGEFFWASLKQKYPKKIAFIQVARLLGLYKDVRWRANSEFESQSIIKFMKVKPSDVYITGDLPIKNIPDDLENINFNTINTQDKLKIIFLSRISREKNLDYALKVLCKVKANVSFDIYGPMENKGYWNECQELINKLPSNIIVSYRGIVNANEVVQMFSHYDLFLFPTGGEAYGHVIAECLISGTPVLISTETPWRSLHSDNFGWDISLTQINSFVEKIEDLALSSYADRFKQRNIIKAKIADHLLDPVLLETNRQLFMGLL